MVVDKRERQRQAGKRWRERNLESERARGRASYYKNKEVRKTMAKQWMKYNPEKAREISRKSYHKNRDKNRDGRIYRTAKYVYGIDKATLFVEQGECCAVCGSTSPGSEKKSWAVDHCHNSGVVRGILCFSCNVVLGHVRDDVERLEKLINYLNKHSSATSKSTNYRATELVQ
jgi:hypothetical protein